jgi:hypothetical protein
MAWNVRNMPNVAAEFGRPFEVPSQETNAGYTTVAYSTRMRFVSCAGANGSEGGCGGGGARLSAISDGTAGGASGTLARAPPVASVRATSGIARIARSELIVLRCVCDGVDENISEFLPSDRKAPEVRQHAGVMRGLDQGLRPQALLRWHRVLEERWRFR